MKVLLNIGFFIVVIVLPFLVVYPLYQYFKQPWILLGYTGLQIVLALFLTNNKKVSSYLKRKGILTKGEFRGGA
jgi:hypothetical protein